MSKRNLAIEIREQHMATKTIAERIEQMLPLLEALQAETRTYLKIA